MKSNAFLITFLVIISVVLTFAVAPASAQPIYRVLILNSYHEGMIFSDDEMRGIRSALPPNVDVFVEFMDTKRNSSPEYFDLLFNVYQFKYRDTKFDVILSLDDDAFQFLRKHSKTLFPGVPVVFCGVNNYTPSMLQGHPEITGVVETIDIKDTILIGLQLHPGTDKVLVVTDNTTTGKTNRAFLEELARSGEIKAEFIFLDAGSGLMLSELIEKLRSAPQKSIVYYADFFQERGGESLNPDTVMQSISAVSAAPIYAHGGLYLGYGIVGGKLNSGFYHGQIAGKMAARILAGESVSAIPVLERSQNQYLFDYTQLRRWGVKESDLPPGSILINREPGVFERYRYWIMGILLFILIQSGVIGFLTININRRRKAEFALRENEQKYKETTDLLPQIIFELDQRGIITFANQIAFEKFGYAREDIESGLHFTQMIIEVDRQRAISNLSNLQKDSKIINENMYTALRKDGSTFPISIYTAPIIKNEEFVGFRGVIIDITEQKQAEDAIRRMNAMLEQRVSERTAELEAVNKELEAFSYSVSHDLRAPLRGMAGYSQALLEDYGAKIDSQGQFYLSRIRAASQRMSELIDDLLMLSRMMRSEMNRQEINLSQIARLIAEELQTSQPERQVEWKIAPDLQTYADPHLMRILLYNLLENAWKFTSKHPCATIEVGKHVSDGQVVFYVRDDGAGFENLYAEKLFRAFQRLHSDQEFPGTGIGLATVLRIVRRHGGKIWAEAEPEKGATFSFTLS